MSKTGKKGTTVWLPDKQTRDNLNKMRKPGESVGQMIKRKLGL